MAQKLDAIHHTAIPVKNIAKAVTWYLEYFACEIEYQDESWAMFKIANTSLALVLPEQHPHHFVILTDDLSPYGDTIPHLDGDASVYIQDVDENNVEMLTLPKRDGL